MLSILPKTVKLHDNVIASFFPGSPSDTGRTWHILINGKQEYKIELPLFDTETSLLHYRKNRYGMANIALPIWPRILERIGQANVAAVKKLELEIEDWEIVALSGIGPEQWHYNDYHYKSGLRLAQEALSESLVKAFAPDQPAKPHWIQERIMREIRTGSTDQQRVATIFYLVDSNKPLDAEMVQRTVLFRDRDVVGAWLDHQDQAHFVRSSSFAGRIDFLATQGDDSLYKGFLLEGVSIDHDKGTLEGQASRTMSALTYCTPFGNAVDPVRGGIISRSNRAEALPLYAPEDDVVQHNEQDELGIMFVPKDQAGKTTTKAPGINATVGLVTWPNWLYKDCVLVSRSFAERAVHQVPQRFTFWTGEYFEFHGPARGDSPDKPTRGMVDPKQVICLDGDRTIKAPDDLLRSAVIDPDSYKRQASLCQDTERPIVWFTLDPSREQSRELRHRVYDNERQMTAAQFIASRGLCGDPEMAGHWQLVRLPDLKVLEPDELIGPAAGFQARPFRIQWRHQLTFISSVPLITGSKISTRTGAYKGVCRVVDDSLMPYIPCEGGDEDTLDMLIAQENVPSRGIALPLLGEMALGKKAQRTGCVARIGRKVNAQQVLAVAGEEAMPEQICVPQLKVRFMGDNGQPVEGILVMNVATWGEVNYWAVSVDGQLVEVCDKELTPFEDGKLIHREEPHVVRGVTGPLYLMIMNRHPLVVSGIRPKVKYNSALLPQKGDGSVSISLNEVQVMRSLGMHEAAAHFAYQDGVASNYARELADSLLGGIFRPEVTDMTELEQALTMRGLDRSALDKIDPALVDLLADVAAGKANTRRSVLIDAKANSHWQFSVVQQFSMDPAFKSEEQAWRGELSATVRYALYLQEEWPWKLISEIDDQLGGSICTFQRMVQDPRSGQMRAAAQVVYRKVVRPFETRRFNTEQVSEQEMAAA